ncbi:uncharacterized protein LOC132255762 [Phlebotomus argentipes]|uniref:uncharacterized protein LOC132255762 n=1 Tax=Phlebotomus argentipes TaxID=94469 RepID=UPI002892BD62|nr:uncharacterized protein LOC132255762 [Phlebotomus argentipes]
MVQVSSSASILLVFLCCCTHKSAVMGQYDAATTPEISPRLQLDDAPSTADGPQPEVIDVKNLPPFPILRNTLLDSDNEVESFNGYHYDRPDIPFEDTNVKPVEVQGYSYPRPSNPLTLPERPLTSNNVQDVQEDVSRNVVPETDERGPPVIDLPEDAIRILDDDVVAVEDEPQDAPAPTDVTQ